MNIFLYQEKEKHRQGYCEVCGKPFPVTLLHPHHIYHKRNGDECIWVCFGCHRYIHDHPKWAYDNGYLYKFSVQNNMTKKKKSKKCTHGASYFDPQAGSMVCQFCKKPLSDTEAYSKKKSKSRASKSPVSKMGYEKSNQQIEKAENLKSRYQELNFLARRSKDAEKKKAYKKEAASVKSRMLLLQDEMNL